MNLQRNFSQAIMTAAWLSMPLLAIAQTQPLSLKHGVYVVNGTACKGAPNAAIVSWDGIGFAGAHSSKCRSNVVHRDGAQFQVSTTCSELGDGASNPTGVDAADAFSLTRLSSTRFEMIKDSQGKSTYRWCGMKIQD